MEPRNSNGGCFISIDFGGTIPVSAISIFFNVEYDLKKLLKLSQS